MTASPEFQVIIFKSVHHALRAEKILKEIGIPHKLIPVPRHISSDCGVCLRFPAGEREHVEQALAGKFDIDEIRPLENQG
ncbi:MAG: DUF3343 domain-containing protein [Syntrophales bacterium]|nr:DUF3343 domain-containing protein [Syntrophales bacterium]MDD5234227.1 DUF3343 domain-containing protein [Syntrophales bacterium]